MPDNSLTTGYAPSGNALATSGGRYAGLSAEQLLGEMRQRGWTQEGVNALYALRGLSNPPQIGALEGQAIFRGRSGGLVDPRGKPVKIPGASEIISTLQTITQQAVDPYTGRSGISNLAGGILNTVGSYVGGPVWTAITGIADAGNKALGNDDGTSYTDGYRSGADRAGALIGSVAGSMNGPGSYGANNAPDSTQSWVNDFAPEGSGGSLSGAGNALGGMGGAGGANAGSNSMGWDWGTIINTGATLLGGYMAGEGAKDAANASAAGSAAAIAESRRQYDQSRADQMPWLEAGRNALTQLQNPAANFQASPDYAFRRDEGTRDIGNSFSARGGAQSGNALRALTDFNSGLAGGEFNNWWNRQAGLAGIGQTSAQNLGSLGANSAANIGNALQNGANARASGVEGQTNAYTGALADLLSQYNRNRKPQYGWGG